MKPKYKPFVTPEGDTIWLPQHRAVDPNPEPICCKNCGVVVREDGDFSVPHDPVECIRFACPETEGYA